MNIKNKRRTRKVKSFVKENKIGITLIICILALAISIIIIFSPKEEVKQEVIQTKYEITEVDVFSLDNFNSKEISVMGIALGNKYEEVIKKLGTPDSQRSFPPSIINLEYGSQIGLTGLGLIIHLQNNVVKRITIREPFNVLLLNQTKIQYTKEDILAKFGKPDVADHVPESETSARVFKTFLYINEGITFIMRADKQVGFSLEYTN